MNKAAYDAKRKAILGDVTIKEETPKCKCGIEMVRRHGKGIYWCPLCVQEGKSLRKASKFQA